MTRDEGASLIRHEEELHLGKTIDTSDSVRLEKHVETEHVSEVHARQVEDASVERLEVGDMDSGEIETLPDGSISVPIFEERLVVTKQRFVRERVVIRKNTTTHDHVIDAELLKERIEVEGDLNAPSLP